jgi:glutamine synthetase
MDYVENGLNFYAAFGPDIQSMVPKGTGYARRWPSPTTAPCPTCPPSPSCLVKNTANITVDPYWYDGTPAMASPRLLLKKLLGEFDRLGYVCRLGYEFEFYVLRKDTKKPAYTGQPIFVTLKNNFDIDFTYDLMRKMDQAGVRIITQNSEHGPGQQEINLYYKDGLPAADTAFLYKMGAKESRCSTATSPPG